MQGIIKDISIPITYTKISKLIMALFMVTDIIEKDESIRNKLRTLGTDLISDITFISFKTEKEMSFIQNKVTEILSLLEVAVTVKIISVMNHSILKKEFSELKKSIQEYRNSPKVLQGTISISDLMKDEITDTAKLNTNKAPIKFSNGHELSNGHVSYKGQLINRTRIGVQKGSTLMSVLSNRLSFEKDNSKNFENIKRKEKSNIIKSERQDVILSVVKNFPNGVNISDIKKNSTGVLLNCSMKTIQRELSIMVSNNVLKKTGSKRWIKYKSLK